MDKARSYQCSECGGEVDSRARTCRYCSAPVATVRCAHCYEMNVPDALHCSGCGRELGLEPVGSAGSCVCPTCSAPLEKFQSGPGSLHDCGRCGGQFVEHALLRELLERRQLYGETLRQRHVAQNPLKQPLRYVKCPECSELMNRRNFGRTSGVIIDICHRHGIWFDAGELPRILAFVEAGGLALARQRELEELQRNQAFYKSSNPASIDRASVDASRISGATSLVDDLGEATLALLAYVKEKIFHG
ncbi:MAG TPA: zf-TFIIB domain-containing protein [Polyangiaceae bacterium]|nr:zf-TFIIB domain-containing protein [Polyangiaceae bacterium]